MKVGSLFSGIGGLDLGLEWAGMETVWQSEVDEFCRGVLRRHFPKANLYGDVNEIDASELAPVDLICGGFPCQPVSLAGKRKGHADKRWLWPSMLGIIRHHRPAWVFGENTPGLISLGLDGILADLEAEGYACRTFVVPACAVDAPHRRDRVFVVANSISGGFDSGRTSESRQEGGGAFSCDASEGGLAYSESLRRRAGFCESEEDTRFGGFAADSGCESNLAESYLIPSNGRGHGSSDARGERPAAAHIRRSETDLGVHPLAHWRGSESILCHDGKSRRVKSGVRLLAHGVSGRVARLKALGNAVVPQVAYVFGRAILEAETTISKSVEDK